MIPVDVDAEGLRAALWDTSNLPDDTPFSVAKQTAVAALEECKP